MNFGVFGKKLLMSASTPFWVHCGGYLVVPQDFLTMIPPRGDCTPRLIDEKFSCYTKIFSLFINRESCLLQGFLTMRSLRGGYTHVL